MRVLARFIGSSGILSGVAAVDVEACAAERGVQITAANLGMAKLSNLGTVELIEFVQDTIRKTGKEIAFIVYELEIMQLSVLPTGREIETVKSYLQGNYTLGEVPGNDPWTRWNPEFGGSI